MGKLIAMALIGLGIYIGMTYKDGIEDMLHSSPAQQLENKFDNVGNNMLDHLENIADNIEQKIENML